MFKYTFERDADIKVLTSFNMNYDKKEVTNGQHYKRYYYTYPNGLTVEMIEYPNKTVLKSNREFVENGDGTFDILI
ncbi:hypothetical protein [Alkalibaculum bacchi]|uniref:hypothetical protein n=1 Tax=Alkalibaculum bacchi TaxID=645887 RepID=UPI0026ECCC76|nr:hypothetical protein [Alkalibaculum bacchi]